MKTTRGLGSPSSLEQQRLARLKVLVAGSLPPPLGGITTYFRDLLKSSLPQKVQFRFVQTSTHNRELAQAGHASLKNIHYATKDCLRFLIAIIAFRPNICHIATAFGLSFIKNSTCVVLGRLFCKNIILHPRCSLTALYSDRPAWWRWMFRQVIRLTSGVIGLSSEWKKLPEIIPGSRVFFLQNGIDLAPYQDISKDRLSRKRIDNDIHVLYLGYLGKAKGSFDLIEAAHLINCDGQEIYFELVGDELHPGEMEQLSQAITEHNLQRLVTLHSSVVGKEKLECFQEADIFAYPSYSEGLPIAVIEAMASGLPVVASNVGGLPDLVEEGANGFLVEPGNPSKLAEALHKTSSDALLRQSMGKSSRDKAFNEYDIEKHVNGLVKIYSNFL